jgi:hypothetical protein
MELLGVQKAALQASAGKHGFAFFLEQGLGKTLLTLSEFVQLVAAGECSRMVVVCPNSFKHGWKEEIEKYNINVEPWVYRSGADNHHFLNRMFNRPPVLIVNYEAIRSANVQSFVLKFIANRNAMLVFDESIQLKNPKAVQTKAAIALSQEFKFSRILSGKPVAQGPHDLWAQFRAIGKLNGRNFFGFRNTFCRMGGWMNKKVTGVQNAELLASLIDPHAFRATKDQWTDLPPKMYTSREYKMTGEQQRQYNMMEKEFVLWLNENENVSVDMAISKYIKLAQIQSGFIIDEDGKTRILVDPLSNPRLLLVKEIIDECIGKVIVPYFHRYSGELLLSALAEYNPAYIRGQMTDTEISAQKVSFNEDPKCRVILLQIRAGKFGHTLLGGPEPENRCSTMCFFENTYSLDDRAQIEDRMHRHGQTASSVLYVDVWGTSLDHKITMALQHKESIFRAIFDQLRGKHGQNS